MNETTRKALQLKAEGFTDDVIEVLLEKPELEESIRNQMKRAAKHSGEQALINKINELKAAHEQLMAKPSLNFQTDWPQLIRMKQEIAELETELSLKKDNNN